MCPALESESTDSPFDEDYLYCVLVNRQGEHSLWPASLPVPAGWVAVGPDQSRTDCLDWISARWTVRRLDHRSPATRK